MDKLQTYICSTKLDVPDEGSVPEWIELIPTGQFKTADYRSPFVLNNAEAIIRASFAAQNSDKLLVDFDHKAHMGIDGRAAGWIAEMKVDKTKNRIMARVEWTPEGKRALQHRSFTRISPTFRTNRSGEVTLIDGAGLVNTPALPQLQNLASKKESIKMNLSTQIAKLLGISEDDPEKIIEKVKVLFGAEKHMASLMTAGGLEGELTEAAVKQLCSRLEGPEADPAKYVPIENFTELQTQFASLQQQVNGEKVNAAIAHAKSAGKLTPPMEAWAVQYATKDLAGFEAWAASAGKVVPTGVEIAKTPPSDPKKLSEDELHMCSAMGLTEEQFIAARH